jgi:hypothetical protein
MVLLEVFLCLCDVVQELVLFLVLLLCRSSECCFSWWSSSGRLLVLPAAVVLPAPASSSVTKLLVSCVLVSFTQLDLIHPWPCCETAMHSSALYPSDLKEQLLHLVIKLNDAMAKYLPKSESNIL